MIEVKNLCKRYGGVKAVDGVSFTAESGEVVGLLGPNGAGKSTTMNIITGYLGATSGDVLIDGVDILETPKAACHHFDSPQASRSTTLTCRTRAPAAQAVGKAPGGEINNTRNGHVNQEPKTFPAHIL